MIGLMLLPGDEVERRLREHAEERLSPSPAAVARMRARVEEAARIQLRPAPDAAPVPRPSTVPALPRSRAGRRGWQKASAMLAAASLAVVIAAGASAAVLPGGLLYPVRVWAEGLVVPGDADERARAEIELLDSRLQEATGATARRDGNGAAAALDAYQALVDDLVTVAQGDEERLGHLEDALERHLEVLESLETRVPPPAKPALERAIQRSDRAMDRIEQQRDPDANPTPDRGGRQSEPSPGRQPGKGGR